MVVGVVLDAEVDERHALAVEDGVIGGAGPVVGPGAFVVAVPEVQARGLEEASEVGVMRRPSGPEGAARHHVQVDDRQHGAQRHRRYVGEGLRAHEPLLLGVEGGQDHGVRGRVLAQLLGQREQRRHAGGVVVGAVVDLPGADAEVVVVGRDEEHLLRKHGPLDPRREVDAVATLGQCDGLAEAVVEGAREAALAKAALHEVGRAVAAGRSSAPPLEGVARERRHVGEELRRDLRHGGRGDRRLHGRRDGRPAGDEAERQPQDQKQRAAHYSTTRGTRKAVSVGGRQMRSSQTA